MLFHKEKICYAFIFCIKSGQTFEATPILRPLPILQMISVPQLDVIEVGEGMDMVHSEEAVPAVTLPAGTNKDQQLMVDTTEIVAGVSVDNLSSFHFELRILEQITHDFNKEKQLTDCVLHM